MENETIFRISNDGRLELYEEPYATIECETEEDYKNLTQAVKKQLADKWVSISERLPEEQGWYLVTRENRKVDLGHWFSSDSGTKSSLMWETLHIIEQMGVWKPRIVIWENVKNVLSKYMIHNFNKYLSKMQKMGYTNSFETLNAMDFGLPQNRNRVFTISYLDGTTFDFDDLIKTVSPHIRELLEDTEEEKYIVTQPSMLKVIDKKPKNFNGYVKIIDSYCETITTKQMRSPNSGVICLGDGRYRYLTELECWRLQGYSDDDFYNALSVHPGRDNCLNGALYSQAGNSIPVTIFESIFKKIFYGEVA